MKLSLGFYLKIDYFNFWFYIKVTCAPYALEIKRIYYVFDKKITIYFPKVLKGTGVNRTYMI